jgi:hypothetical protein
VAGALDAAPAGDAGAEDAGTDAAGALAAGADELAAVAGLLAAADAALEGEDAEPLLDELLQPTIASAAALAAVRPRKKRRAIRNRLMCPVTQLDHACLAGTEWHPRLSC